MIDIEDKIREIQRLCKVQRDCCGYDKLGLDRRECENKATDMVAELWGFTPDMVLVESAWHRYRFDNIEKISVGESLEHIDIEVSRSPNGLYSAHTSWFFSISGHSALPCIWERTQYESRKEAITTECEWLVKSERIQSDKIGARLVQKMVDKVAEMFPVYEQMELEL